MIILHLILLSESDDRIRSFLSADIEMFLFQKRYIWFDPIEMNFIEFRDIERKMQVNQISFAVINFWKPHM